MFNILFKNEDMPIKGDVIILNHNIIRIISESSANTSGFYLLTDDTEHVFGDYTSYTTLYRSGKGFFELSNNESVYNSDIKESIDIEQIKNRKIKEIERASEEYLRQGYTVTLTDGKEYEFPLSQEDEIQLMGLASEVAMGTENIPWHTTNKNEPCRFFSNADAKIFTDKALALKTWNVTYLRDLTRYINSLEKEEDINKISYGMQIPFRFQSEPLKAMMAAQS